MSTHGLDNRKLSPALIRAINRYLLVKTDIQSADLCLLFGGRSSADARVRETFRLWQAGFFHLIVVTGGRSGSCSGTEAEQMAGMLRKLGVPAAQIIIENGSRNTGENVVFSINLLKRLGHIPDIRSVIAVGRFSASRRYLMTLERHWPEVFKMLAPVNHHAVDTANWFNDPLLCAEVVVEWGKLRPYFNAGFLKELNPRTCKLIAD